MSSSTSFIRSVTSDENWEEWIIYILKGIEVVAKKTINKDLTIKELFVHLYSKIEFITKVLGVERKAASRYLSQLQDIGVLKEYKIGREKIYINVEFLEALKHYSRCTE